MATSKSKSRSKTKKANSPARKLRSKSTAPKPTPERIMQFLFGYAPPLMLEAAIRHRVFDVLDSGPKTVEQVSHETGASERGLRALMDGLVGLEFLSRTGNRYRLAPDTKAFLVSTRPAFFGGLLKHTSTQLMPKWMHLNESVRTGKPALAVNQQEAGSAFFEEFVEGLFPLSYPVAQALGDALKIASSKSPFSVLDLAAGSGVWGVALAQKSPRVSVTAVDWPAVLETTRRFANRFGLTDRFHFTAGDLLEADFGTNHHLATLGHILHSEGQSRSQKLLQKTFDALAPGGTIAIAEFLVNDTRTAPPGSLIFAINMLINTDEGSTYTFPEISRWLKAAGFIKPRLLNTGAGPSPLVLANKPG